MRKQLIFLSVLAILLTSCAVGSARYDSEVLMESGAPMSKGMDSSSDSYFGEAENSITSASYQDQGIQTQEIQTRMVIKNASLSIVVVEAKHRN